jgi:hypothetical protein
MIFLLTSERDFDFHFAESFDKGLHAGCAQRLDQLIGRGFMRICE